MTKWTPADIPSLHGRLAVVTGANSGIGWHTALELARAGSEVILASRTESKGRDAVDRIRQEVPQAKVRAEVLDLASFALTMSLMPALMRASSPRVTTVSSGAANMGLKKINFGDLQWERSYGPWTAYCQSKLADLMFALELGRRSASAGIPLVSNAAHPGYARTNLQTSGPGRQLNRVEKIVEVLLSHDAVHGALPTLRAATTEDAVSGSYFAPDRMFQLKGDPVPVPIPKAAQNEAAAWQLWETAEGLTGAAWRVVEPATAFAVR